LLLLFAAVVSCFVAATTYSEIRLAEIDQAVRNISRSGLPAIEHLVDARTSLRHLQQFLVHYVDLAAEDAAPPRAELVGLRHALDDDLRAYEALPNFSAFAPAWQSVRRAVESLDQAINRLIGRVDARDFAGAQARLLYDLEPAAERLDATILALVEAHVATVYRMAMQITTVRQRSMWTAFGLDLSALLLAVVTAFWALRTVAHYTESIEANQRLLSQRADELEQFAGRVAHDVLGPMSTVSLSLGFAATRAGGDEQLRAMLERGQASLRRVEQIVDGLLTFARAGANPEPGAAADLRETIDGVMDEVREPAARAGVELRVVPIPPVRVACSPGVLTSLIANLVHNAIKYIGDGPERRVSVRAISRGALCRVEVEDTGPGLPPSLERAVFEPYVRAAGTRQPGIGLGLATVKKIAQAHGGAVGVRSVPGRGSTFWFELPRADQK
jgi:signal transduction histidine kinase